MNAVHPSTALEFLQIYPDLTIASLDRRILDNVVLLGLKAAVM